MRRIGVTSLIRRGFSGNPLPVQLRAIVYFHFFFATLNSARSYLEKEKPISSKPRFDFSCIRELDDAVCLFHEMVRMRPRPYVTEFSMLLNVVVKMKHYHAALRMFDEMHHLGIGGINGYRMSIAINCYCLLNRVDFGFSILGRYFKLGHQPCIVTFSTLIKGLFLADKAYDAVEVFKKLFREKLLVPNEVTYLAVINGLCKAGYTLMARDLLGVLENRSCKPNVYSYNTIINSLCKDEMVNDALQLFSQMVEKSIYPNEVTYNSVIQGFRDYAIFVDGKK